MPRFIRSFLLLALIGFLSVSCAGFYGYNRSERSSSIVEYLYPDQSKPLPTPTVPVLRLPLRVGVAFVPSARNWGGEISEQQKQQMIQRVAEKFRTQGFISHIETIPSSYLRPAGGLANLQQAGRMLQLDLAVLVAYDQMQYGDENLLAFSYWTIVGSYIFKGNKNDTQTLVEAAVYDIPTGSFLFRAPGANRIESSSTGVRTSERQRLDSATSLSLATDDLISNLDAELVAFKQKIKEGRASVQIEHREGYTGGGAIDVGFAVSLLGLVIGGLWRRRS